MTQDESRISLHAHLHGILQEWLAPPLRDLFDELDARLFNLAERSRSGTQQQQYFDALRQLRLERVNVETRFLQEANQAMDLAPVEPPRAPSRTGLELLDKDEQEETLQLEQRTQRLSERTTPALIALLARLAELTNCPQPSDPQTCTLSPRGMGRVFRTALAPADVSTEIRLIVLDLFGQHVLQVLEPMYAQLNATLREAGILPDLVEAAPSPWAHMPSPHLQRIPKPLTQPATPEAGHEGLREPPPPQPDGNELRIVQLHQLLEQHRQLAATSGAVQPIDGDRVVGYAIEAALASGPQLSPGTVDAALDALWTYDDDPLGFKSQLLDKARRLAGLENACLGSAVEDVVDMIGLLFHRIHNDAELPAPMRDLLTRMHLPFLRSALKEPGLLHGSTHPARELLDELGALATGWCAASDPDGQLLKQVALTVEQLASRRQGVATEEYAQVRQTLLQQLETQTRRAELSEQRAIETTIGRERLELARNRVASLIRQRLRHCEPMPWVRQLLIGPWSHHLALVWLRQNESSTLFRQALAFVDELLWVDEARAGHDHEHDQRLLQARQTLPQQLREGLAGVTLHEREIAALAHRLEDFLDAQVQGVDPPDFLYENDPTLTQVDLTAPWQETVLEDQPHADQIPPDLIAQLHALTPGTWFEFQPSSQVEAERAKLCWISPYSGNYLFVNRNGSKTRELTAIELLDVLETNLTRILDDHRLLERNLRSLIEQLRNDLDPAPGIMTPEIG